MDGQLYESVGIECGEADGQELIGIMYPTAIEGECDVRYMTMPAAKALLIDLRDAIEACMKHQEK